MKRVSSIITNVAAGYVGYREIGVNEAFENKVLQKLLYDRGWRPGYAWCAVAAELIYWEVYDHMRDEIDRLFSLSVMQTYSNFKAAGWEISDVPEPGALAIWQRYENGKPSWMGHIGVVENFTNSWITSIDGNSNNNGSRNGIEWARVTRTYTWDVNNGNRLIGFILPEEI